LSIVEIQLHDIYSSYINMNLISKTHYYHVRKKNYFIIIFCKYEITNIL